MAETILIASGKGGVGKSTATLFFGRAMAKQGKKVLLIDADTGLGALDILLGVADKTMNTWLDVEREACELENAFLPVSNNLTLLPSPKEYDETLSDDVFARLVSRCGESFDVILIDAPAGIDRNLKRAATACEKAVFIATADEVSVKGAAAAAAETEKFGISRENMRLVINRFQKKAAAKCRLLNLDGVIDRSGVQLLGVLPEDKKIPQSSVTGVLPGDKSKFQKAVERIVLRMDGQTVPLVL